LLEIWREGGGKKRIFFWVQGFFYREREKELFWDSEKIKGSKEKKRIKGEKK
jgi:hypothetical protein